MVYCFAAAPGPAPTTQLRKIFCSLSRDGSEQLTVFQCFVEGTDVYLVLPSVRGTRLVDVGRYPEIFRDLSRLMFPDASGVLNATSPMMTSDPVTPLSVEIWRGALVPDDAALTPEDVSELAASYPPGADHDLVAVRVGRSGLNFPLAYAHPARPDLRLFVPTRVRGTGADDVKWDNLIFTVNTTHSAGLRAMSTNLNGGVYRDLIGGFLLPEIHDIRKILTNVVQPNTDLCVATTGTDEHAIPFIGPDGTRFVDGTNLHVVRFQTYGFNTLPIVNGCFLTPAGGRRPRSPYHFGGGGRCTFDEEEGGRVRLTDDAGSPLETVYYVYPGRVIRQDDQFFLEYEPEAAPTDSPGPQ